MRFRIGLHLGDVMIRDGDLFGGAVNIAARLQALAEPGGICVSASVREHIGTRLAAAFADAGPQQVKNIAEPVHVFRVAALRPAQPSEPLAALPLPDKPSVAVLPFTNMSGDAEQEFFADGIAEDVITALSRYPSLFVIARNSCFTYKGRAVDVKQVGRELGVRYVLEGGLRKASNRIRVTAQLVEAETGKHVWAERYDRDFADIFALQDEITEAVTIAIAPAIAAAEQQRAMRKPPGSIDAWAVYQRGLWHFSKFIADDNAAAQTFFQQAIDLDPTFTGAYSGLAATHFYRAAVFQTGSLPKAQKSMEELARRAVALDGGDAEARSWLGAALFFSGDDRGALAEVERALAISPNLAIAYGMLGCALIWSGRPNEGLAALGRYMRLDPRDPMKAMFLYAIAVGLYFSREYEAAIEAAERVIRSYPDFPMSYRWIAAALGQLGRAAEAKEALEKAIAISPASFDMYVRQRVPWFRPEDHAHLLEGLRKAGWQG
jgi:adenylate cyclase